MFKLTGETHVSGCIGHTASQTGKKKKKRMIELLDFEIPGLWELEGSSKSNTRIVDWVSLISLFGRGGLFEKWLVFVC